MLDAVVLTGVAAGVSACAGTTDEDCDRDCLIGIMENYEAAVLADDPSGLPFAETARSIENYRPIEPGEGYWDSFGNIYNKQIFADPVSGQVATVGMADHEGAPAWYVMRLKVEDGEITQTEVLLVHEGDASFVGTDTKVPVASLYQDIIPEEQRISRDAMIALVDRFTDAWQFRNEDLTRFAAECDYFENNLELTQPGGPAGDTCGGMLEYGGRNGMEGAGKAGQAGPPPPGAGEGASAPSPTGGPPRVWHDADPSIGLPALYGTQMFMRDRRYPIVDVERGVVLAYHIQGGQPARPGEEIEYERPTPFVPMGSVPPEGGPGAGAPPESGPLPGMGGAAYMAGLFKIVNGEIVRVDHFEFEGGRNASSGFSDSPRF